ncbi:hypothetical protein A946_09130 [Methylacidiphilum kamchatkense Kam1]|uniref:DUF5069 domain-containing protein n=1 Tax=Methylacidiphilum kamchatkense Kam1 TaxID=1202785 RepID=A0A0C1V314_9BACT|nr:DUF5069 domain-containing protein [Methylacidiphilum kamchatkense]KIE58065.1 hypothetical protein A946_09130 [Methylacidiphilum kamchatkense Kam1]QDQ41624.1 putative protein DUF5069 [Methylacidiphilum kamchatkense Kam1]
MDYDPFDLTQHPPRSPRVRLGGFVLLPRVIDKGRALLKGKIGEYKFNCPMDQKLFSFLQINEKQFLEILSKTSSDKEVLREILKISPPSLASWQIENWSSFLQQSGPSDLESKKFFVSSLEQIAPEREDIVSWFDLLDLDDYVSFGGKP